MHAVSSAWWCLVPGVASCHLKNEPFSTRHALVATRVLLQLSLPVPACSSACLSPPAAQPACPRLQLSLPVPACAEQALKEKAGSITRADTAAVCVEALSNPAAEGVTIAISGKPLTGDYEAQLKELFSGTVKDTA
jgi:hypothetical protein